MTAPATTVQAPRTPPVGSPTASAPRIALIAPVTLAAVRRRWPALLPIAVVTPLVLGLAAAVNGRLLAWDEPITDAAVGHRTAWLDAAAIAVSRLGSWVVVFPVGLLLAVVASRRSARLATVIVVTIGARPAVEWLLKEVVARPRPSGARLVDGTGFSYPSGHVLAAAATWAFLPPVVALFCRRRGTWWAAVGFSGAIITLVAWSRVWLGVHWTSDVVASLCLSFLALGAVEAWLGDRARPSPGPSTGPARSELTSVAGGPSSEPR
jgi:undecaprenyl-diphosphatase